MFEAFSSLIHNYKSKIRNPFFGTLVSIWLIRNWSIVYAVFNFDKVCTMQDKINYVQEYFIKKEFWREFFINISLSFSLLVVTYILLGFTRLLTDLYYKRCEPWIITKIDNIAILTERDKTRLENRISHLSKKMNLQSTELSFSENDNKILLEQIKNLKSEIVTKSDEINGRLDKMHSEQEAAMGVMNSFDEIIKHFNSTIELIEKDIYYVGQIDFKIENITSDEKNAGILFDQGLLIKKDYEYKYILLGDAFVQHYINMKKIK